jgi:hypothetical protein
MCGTDSAMRRNCSSLRRSVSATRFCSVMSTNAPRQPRGRPAGSNRGAAWHWRLTTRPSENRSSHSSAVTGWPVAAARCMGRSQPSHGLPSRNTVYRGGGSSGPGVFDRLPPGGMWNRACAARLPVMTAQSASCATMTGIGSTSIMVESSSTRSCSSRSTRLRSEMSRTKATVSPASRGQSRNVNPMSTHTRVPSLRTYCFSYGVHAPRSRASARARSSAWSHSGGVRCFQPMRPSSNSSRV